MIGNGAERMQCNVYQQSLLIRYRAKKTEVASLLSGHQRAVTRLLGSDIWATDVIIGKS